MTTTNRATNDATRLETEVDRRWIAREAALIAKADADTGAGRFVHSAKVKARIERISTDRVLPVP